MKNVAMNATNEIDGRRPATAGLTFSVQREAAAACEVAVAGPVVTIGRDPACTLCFGDAATVSGRHAEITVRHGRCMIRDTRSQNHTFVNGVRIEGPVPLGLHDEIRLGMSGPRLRLVAIGACRPESAAVPPGRREQPPGRQAVAGEGAACSERDSAVGDRVDPAPAYPELPAEPAPRRARDLLVARRAPERPAPGPDLPADDPAANAAAAGTGTTTKLERLRAEMASLRRRSWLPLAAVPLAVLVALGGAWSAGLLPSLPNWRALLGKTERSVALIRCVTKGRVFPEIVSESSGSGFLIDAAGRVATNFHVIDGIDEATVRFAGDDAWHPVAGAVVALPGHDLAVIDIGAAAARGRRPLRLEPTPPAGTDEVVAIGSPGGVEFISSRGTVEKTTPLASLKEQLWGHQGRQPAVDESAAAAALEKLRGLRAEYEPLDARGRQEFLDRLVKIEGGPTVTHRDLIRSLEHILSENTVRSAAAGPAEDLLVVIHSASIAQGNSGGPLLDAAGAVVGVNAGVVGRGGVARDFRYAIAARHLVENMPPADSPAKPFAEAAR